MSMWKSHGRVLLVCVALVTVGRAQQAPGPAPPVSANPEAARHYALCQDALAARDAGRAVEHAEKAAALDPTNARILMALGDAYGITAQEANILRKMSWASKCREAYLKGAQADPRDLEVRNRLISYYLQAPGIAGGGHDKAVAMAQEIARIDPMAGHRARAQVFLDQKKPLDAIAELERALAVDARDRTTANWLLTLCVRNNQLPRAQALVKKYEQEDPFRGHLARMVVASAREDWAAAAAATEAALRVSPADTETQFTLANLYVRMEKLDAAAALYQQMVARDESLRDAWYGLGRYSAVTGKELDRGLSSFDTFLALTASHERSRQSSARWRKGMIFARMGDTAKARAEYQAAIQLNSKNADARKSLAQLPSTATR